MDPFLLRSAALLRQKQLEQASAANEALLSSLGCPTSRLLQPSKVASSLHTNHFGVSPIGFSSTDVGSLGQDGTLNSLLKLATSGSGTPQGATGSQALLSQVLDMDDFLFVRGQTQTPSFLDSLAQQDQLSAKTTLTQAQLAPCELFAGSPALRPSGFDVLQHKSPNQALCDALLMGMRQSRTPLPASADIGWTPPPFRAPGPREGSDDKNQQNRTPVALLKKSLPPQQQVTDNDSAGHQRKTKREHFPERLMRILQEVDRDPHLHGIVSFSKEGTAVEVHDVAAFEKSILGRYFNHGRICSFRRQLHIYGFKRLRTCKPNTLQFRHPDFRQDCPKRCFLMERINTPGNMAKNTT